MTSLLRSALSVWATALLLGGLAASADASPITYSFTSGTATVTVTSGLTTHTPVGGVELTMNGIFVIFDDMIPELIDFEQTLTPAQSFSLTTPYGGFDDVTVESASLKPAGTYSQSAGFAIIPGTLYQVTVGPVLIDAVYSASFSGGSPPDPVNDVMLSFENPSLTATINLGGIGELSMSEVTLGVLPAAGFEGETEDLVIKADIVWQGVMVMAPEPGTSALLGIALVALLVSSRRLVRA